MIRYKLTALLLLWSGIAGIAASMYGIQGVLTIAVYTYKGLTALAWLWLVASFWFYNPSITAGERGDNNE